MLYLIYADGGLIGVDKSMRLTESLNLTIDQAGLENLTMSESKKDQLKAAFLLYCNGNMGHATSIIEDLFPVSEGASISSAEPDASMDRLVVAISTDLIDDQVWSENLFTRASTFQALLRQVLLRDDYPLSRIGIEF